MFLRFERKLLAVGGTLNMTASLFMLTALLVFPAYCWSRDYLLYPNYNYLSWSYAAGLLSVIATTLATGAYFQEMSLAKEREHKNQSILYTLYPDLDPRVASPLEVYSYSGSGGFL